MYVCITYMYVYLCIICMYVCVCVCVCMYVCVRMYVCMYYMHVCVCMYYIYVCICACVCMYVLMYMHVCVYIRGTKIKNSRYIGTYPKMQCCDFVFSSLEICPLIYVTPCVCVCVCVCMYIYSIYRFPPLKKHFFFKKIPKIFQRLTPKGQSL
jgi:hypothetical protein